MTLNRDSWWRDLRAIRGLIDMHPSKLIARDGTCILRTWEPEDQSWYADLVSTPEVMRFIGDGQPRTQDMAAREIAGFQEETRRRGWSRWVVENAGRPVGYVGFSVRQGRIDWGGRSSPQVWGTRVVVQAAVLALRAGSLDCGIAFAEATTVLENRSAWRLNAFLGFKTVELYEDAGVSMIRQRIDLHALGPSHWTRFERFLGTRAAIVGRHAPPPRSERSVGTSLPSARKPSSARSPKAPPRYGVDRDRAWGAEREASMTAVRMPCDLRRSPWGGLATGVLAVALLPIALVRLLFLLVVATFAALGPRSWWPPLLKTFVSVAGFRVRVTGLHHLEAATGPTVVAYNHVCLWDCLLVGTLGRGVLMVANPRRNASRVNEDFFRAVHRAFSLEVLVLVTGRSLVRWLRGWRAEVDPAPIFVAPEGTIGHGRGLFAYHATFFGLDAPVLPLALRARPAWPISLHPLLAHHGMNLVWPLLLPWTGWEAAFLPPMSKQPEETAKAFARRVQVRTANALGVPATSFYSEDKAARRAALAQTSAHRRWLRALWALDRRLLRWAAGRDPVRGAGWARLATELGKTPTYLVLSLLLMGVELRLGFEALCLLLMTETIAKLVKGVVRRRRPREPESVFVADWNGRFGFPSVHAADAAAFALFFGFRAGPALFPPLAGVGLIIAASRLRLRAHYPSDVVAGGAIGLLLAPLNAYLVARF